MTPTIPISDDTFGIVHGDAHTGNYMLNYLGENEFTQTTIDFDDAQRSWFIVDPGTVTWVANMSMVIHDVSDREDRLAQFKEWFLDAYGWPTTNQELEQGCYWRAEFMYGICEMSIGGVKRTDPGYWALKTYMSLFEAGKIPTC